MPQQELLCEARDLLAQFVVRVRGAAAMGYTDINVMAGGAGWRPLNLAAKS